MKHIFATAAAALAIVVAADVTSAAVAPTVGTPAVSPGSVLASTPTTVTFTTVIGDPSVLANGVNLLRTDATGKTLSLVAVMHDDGLNGDAVAGDKTFSCRVSVNEAAAGFAYYRVSAAFKAVLLRSLSSVIALTVTANVPQTVRIDTISPTAARRGETVSIGGDGFAPLAVTVTVGGIPATVLAANQRGVTFQVPAQAAPGATQVTALNLGGTSGTVTFQVLDGVLLSGANDTLAATALFDMPPVAAPPGEIVNSVILTRLNVRLAPTATVAQFNDALRRVQGGIVSMSPGISELTIAIPRQLTLRGLEALVLTLNDAPGVAWAFAAREAAAQVLPRVPQFLDTHLLPTLFPAAWNAKRLALKDCTTRKVRILVADEFIRPAPDSHIGFPGEVPNFLPSPPDDQGPVTHGYDVTTTLAARFNEHTPTGANPFSECLDVTGVQMSGLAEYEMVDRIVRNFPPSEKFIVNFSMGFNFRCTSVFDATIPANTCESVANIPSAFTRGAAAAAWKFRTLSRWPDFLATASAGNSNDPRLDDGFAATIYPGIKTVLGNSMMTAATDSDPFFSFIQDDTLWKPTLSDPNLPKLTASAPEVDSLHQALVRDHLDTVGRADNVMVVGSATQGSSFASLKDSSFSNIGADVMAVGENIVTFAGSQNGTSFSAPQVAGLASYLWLVSDDLRRLPNAIAATRAAIEANARLLTGMTAPTIDAYAAVLSIDQAALPTPAAAPVRLAILDVNDDGRFDESDVQEFLGRLLDSSGNAVSPAAADYSRYDLNGDGFTGGSRVERFDLDRVGSTQYGTTAYAADVTQTIEGRTVHFNENGVNDVEILCYYAYSPLFTGDPVARAQQLAGCAGATVDVAPVSVRLTTGGRQQFTATVRGSFDPRVSWSATCGSISQTGFYTAGSSAATCTVRATSVVDSAAFGEAAVIVQNDGTVFAGQLSYSEESLLGGGERTQHTSASWSVAARVELRADGTFGPTQITGSSIARSTLVQPCDTFRTVTTTFLQNETIDVRAGQLREPGGVPLRFFDGEPVTLSGDGGTSHVHQTDTDPNNPCGVTAHDADGTAGFYALGRLVYQDGRLVAIDFAIDYTNEFTLFAVQSGQLTIQP